MRYRVKVYRKGLVVIPAEVRRRLGIYEGMILELKVENNSIVLMPPKTLKDAFGVDGDKALEVAKLIVELRKKEVRREIRS